MCHDSEPCEVTGLSRECREKYSVVAVHVPIQMKDQMIKRLLTTASHSSVGVYRVIVTSTKLNH